MAGGKAVVAGLLCVCLSATLQLVAGQAKPVAIFAFGDSYLDTGNSNSSNYVVPYGETFPGQPYGRFSDGRNFLDWLASFYGLPSPPPFYSASANVSFAQGANFAVGGAGVFNDFAPVANLSFQANSFSPFLRNQTLSSATISTSLFLISLSGNDYQQFSINPALASNLAGAITFVNSVVQGIADAVSALYARGARNFLVFNLSNLGCVPVARNSTTGECLAIAKPLVDVHNGQLNASMTALQGQFRDAKILVADFNTITTQIINSPTSVGLINSNSSCCGPPSGFGRSTACGLVVNGTIAYSLCPTPSSFLYWDSLHPTDNGWRIMTTAMFNGSGYTSPGANIATFFTYSNSTPASTLAPALPPVAALAPPAAAPAPISPATRSGPLAFFSVLALGLLTAVVAF